MTPEREQGTGNKTGLVNEAAARMRLLLLTPSTQAQKSDTCLQGDGFTGPTVTVAIYSNNTDFIEYTTR